MKLSGNARRWRSLLFIVLGAALIVLAAFATHLKERAAADRPAFAHAAITIVRADGKTFSFDVEVAVTEDEEAYGLMHRHSLAENAGMIFIYDPPQNVSMWMKNTPLPLDMLFVRSDGTIAKIATNARPFDVTPINSEEQVKGVVELNAGTANRLGLNTGDKVRYPAFSGQ